MEHSSCVKYREKNKALENRWSCEYFQYENTLASFIWLLLFIFSAAFTVYLIILSINQYYERRVTSTVRYLTEKQSVLPTITICNINPFTSDLAVNLLDEANLKWNDEEEVDYMTIYLELQAYLNRTRGYTLTMKEKLALADPYPTVSLFLLEYQMQTFAKQQYKFDTIFHPKFFTCFVFNRLGQERVSSSQDGIFSLLYTGSVCEQPGVVMFPANIRGVYMFIQNGSDYLYGTDRSPLLIITTHLTEITISRHFYNQYPWPYSECAVLADNSLSDGYPLLHDRFVFDEVIAVTNTSYTRKTCLSFCAQLMIVRRCGCKSNWIGYNVSHSNASYCSLSDQLGCAARVWHSTDEINAECLPKCPLECSHMSFDVRQNINVWKNFEYFAIWFPNGIQNATLEANGIFLTIMYEDLAYVETVEETKISGEDLLGAIGGHLHLFLGMSLLSFVEVIELLIVNIGIGKNTMPKRSKTNQWVNDLQYVKMDAIPNTVRSPYTCVSFVWLTLFVCSVGSCAYFVVTTIQQYNMRLVTTNVEKGNDLTSDIRFCQEFWMTSDLAVAMLSKLGLYDGEQIVSLNAINAYFKKTRGSYLNNSELSLYGDLDRAVVYCDINGKPCEFVFYDGCYRVLPRNPLGKCNNNQYSIKT